LTLMKKVVTLEKVGLFADGAAVRTIGSETFRVCNELVDDMVTVTTDEVRCHHMKRTFLFLLLFRIKIDLCSYQARL
jgi:threonine dehydratase